MKTIIPYLLAFFLSGSTLSFAAHYWEGDVNHSWNNPGNWDEGTVPGQYDDVFIGSGTPNDCWVASTDQKCHNLFIMSGASLRIYDETLNVYGIMQVWGHLKMDHIDGFLTVHDHMYWESGSTASITAYAGIRTYENWEFDSGSSVQLNDGYVQMYGYDDNYITCKSANSWFNVLVIANSGGEIHFNSASTEPLRIKEGFAISYSTFRSYTSESILLDGEFSYNMGHFYMHSGTFVFNGDPSDVDCNTGDYFNNLTINATGDIDMVSNLDINGNLTIDAGNLVTNNHTIRIVGNWYNNIRPYGFDEGSGTVIFYGSGNQYCYGDHFYNLTIDKTNAGNYVSFVPTPVGSYQYTFVGNQTHIQDGHLYLANNAYLSIFSLTIDNGSTLNASTGSNSTISIMGSWTDNNTSSPGFIEGNSRVLIAGANSQQLICPSLTAYDFHDITVNKSNNYFTSTLDLNIYGDIELQSGGWTFYSTTPEHNYYGDINLNGGGFYEYCHTNLTGYSSQTINNTGTTSFDFGPVQVTKPTGLTVTLTGTEGLYTSGLLTFQEGEFIVDNSLLKCNNDIDINSSAQLTLVNGSELKIQGGYTLDVNNGGIFQSIGTAAANNYVSRNTGGYYTFRVNSMGLISAKHTQFQFMDSNGINVLYGGYVDSNNPFDYCSFYNGQSGGTLLKMNCLQNLTIANATFPFNSWGSGNNVSRSTTLGVITFSWANGSFSGEAFDDDPNSVIHWTNQPTDISARIYLEGAFENTDMGTSLNPAMIPLSQPYNTSPWNYTGTESVASIPSASIVDWVLLEVRATDSYFAADADGYTSLAQRAAFLLSDGTITDLDGSIQIGFETAIGANDNVYLVVIHRNHLSVLSNYFLTYSGGSWNCDLTTGPSAIYGGLNACKYLATGKYGMMAGDVNGDGTINAADELLWQNTAGTKAYHNEDLDMNGQVDNKDKNDYWFINNGESTQVPE